MHVLITGATSGIGEACARLFAAHGNTIVATGRRQARLDALQQDLGATHCHTLCFYVTDVDATRAALDSIPEAMRPLDLVINNAGKALGLDSFETSNWAHWDEMLAVNVRGFLAVAQWAAQHLKAAGGGHIINVGSIAGREVYPKGHVYCGTKHAVDAISRGMRQDLVAHHVKVSQIAPGLVDTEFSTVRFEGDTARAQAVYAGIQPLTAADVAQTIYWMATTPPHVHVADVLLLPTAQAASTVVHRKT